MRNVLTLAFLTAACARDDGRWPSLAPRPMEAHGISSLRADAPIPAVSPRPVPLDAGPLARRLAEDERVFARVRDDLALERAATIDAVAAARGAPDPSDARGRAELQITRLDAIAGRLDALAPDVSAIAIEAERAVDPGFLPRARATRAAVDGERASVSRLVADARSALAR